MSKPHVSSANFLTCWNRFHAINSCAVRHMSVICILRDTLYHCHQSLMMVTVTISWYVWNSYQEHHTTVAGKLYVVKSRRLYQAVMPLICIWEEPKETMNAQMECDSSVPPHKLQVNAWNGATTVSFHIFPDPSFTVILPYSAISPEQTTESLTFSNKWRVTGCYNIALLPELLLIASSFKSTTNEYKLCSVDQLQIRIKKYLNKLAILRKIICKHTSTSETGNTHDN